MRKVLSVVLLTVGLAVCTASSHPKPTSTWDRKRFQHARPINEHLRPQKLIPSPTGTPTAQPAILGTRVGALFFHDTAGDHFCTASAVDGPGRNLIITAAHCLHEGEGGTYLTDLVFVPGYRKGYAPYGVWKVKAEVVDARWANHSDPDVDVGFAVLEPLNGKNIGDVLGSFALGVNTGFHNVVRVTGYPMRSDEPITCVNTTSQYDTYQLRFACKGYFPGTSGSPWLTDDGPGTRRGRIVGVIGGFHQGGNVDTVSYSSYFDDDVKHLYEEAVRASTSPT